MVDNVRDFLRKDRRENIQLSYECPSSCGDDGNCSVGFVCVDGRCVSSYSGSTNVYCPSSPVGGSGCEGCDPACENGVIYTDANGEKKCREGKDCGPEHPCPNGSSCQGGSCEPIQCSANDGCDAGLVCYNGVCEEIDGPIACNTQSDCPGGTKCVSGWCAKPCSNTSQCPTGSYCSGGYCTQAPIPCSSNGDCPAGACIDGFCATTCNSSYDCPHGQSCHGGYCRSECLSNLNCYGSQVCLGGICQDNPYPPDVDYPTTGKDCDPSCDTFYKEFGYNAVGCDFNRRCGYCQECWNGVCRDLNPSSRWTPCECKQTPSCKKCVNGEFVEDCGCSECSETFNVMCPCGILIRGPIRACRGACDYGLVSASLLRAKTNQLCNAYCGQQQNPIDQCKGNCQTVTQPCTGFSCPPGYNCTLVGRIEVGGSADCIYENCNPATRPAFCEDEQSLKTLLSVSVIDEDDGYTGSKNADWAAFRASYPTRPFYVLAPGGYVSPPAGWNGGTFTVSRMPGVSNWFSLLSGPLKNASAVLLWIDNSGSMTTATVSGSLALFRSNCAAAGIRVCVKSGANENWIRPHVTDGNWCTY